MASEAKQPDNLKDEPNEPIYTPDPVGPAYESEPDTRIPMYPMLRFGRFLADLYRKPAHWIRENIVEPNRGPKYYYYHRKFPRAVPIDECYVDDLVCIMEADQDYKRNKLVDLYTLQLLRFRRDRCIFWNTTNYGGRQIWDLEPCKSLVDTFAKEETNFFIKYGDLKAFETVINVYNKQKHRMILERRKALRDAQREAESA